MGQRLHPLLEDELVPGLPANCGRQAGQRNSRNNRKGGRAENCQLN